MASQQSQGKIKIGIKQALAMLLPYIWSKILDQIKSVWLIVAYLALFQILVLGIPISQAALVSFGIALVIFGLSLFMEGLFLGLMPLGESCGIRLPQKTILPVMLVFSFILGVGVTFAEPAIGVLQSAGSTVKAWEAPLLFLILNKYAPYLKWAVGIGVGIAVLFGMLRFLYNWSLKPFIYILVGTLTGLSIWAYFEPNMIFITGLAWDCGGVTTGPVTVPLVLALGIGISRVVAKKNGEGGAAGGFGVVTLASAFPILTVILLGMLFLNSTPEPMKDTAFFEKGNREKVEFLFDTKEQMIGYALANASPEASLSCFDGNREEMNAWILRVREDDALKTKAFGSSEKFYEWLFSRADSSQRQAAYASLAALQAEAEAYYDRPAKRLDMGEVAKRNTLAAVQAILPLSIFLFLVLVAVLREKLARPDEIGLGIVLAVIGMSIFNIGIEFGLSKMGTQAGSMVPSSFRTIELTQDRQVISNFDPGVVQQALTKDGQVTPFFFQKTDTGYVSIPYKPDQYDPSTARYDHVPSRGPLFGSVLGIIVVLLFAFILGYSATLAEPALNALGLTVEELTVGTFKKSLLMQTVAVGVGLGIAVGVAKIIYDIPLIWLLVPPYAILMVITKFSTEDFVNIGWDSAGVTTGPVTVPLVLAIGLGIGGQIGAVEGFGILALASAYPILCVLCVGLAVEAKRKAALREVVEV